ncbi:MAG: PIN domain-containing protein, partial [Candidatus Electrothrix sp. ATG1]|nr:PIN domain-containing protein [Candidatus Electrothrix sp. ATG1]
DKHHELAKQRLAELSEQNERMITTCAVMTETCHLLLTRAGISAQQKFIEKYRQGVFFVFELNAEHSERIAELMRKYADLPMDLADASLVVLAEHLGHGRILSTDQRDFHIYRWKNHQPFENLLLTVNPGAAQHE